MRRFRARATQQLPRQYGIETMGTQSSVESSTTQLIPAIKFRKGMGFVGGDGTCAICLSEFEEGEELRILPECLHSYHVECIDMWLHSHTNCPMCRTDATPSPAVYLSARDLDSGRPISVYNIVLGTLFEGMLSDDVVHAWAWANATVQDYPRVQSLFRSRDQLTQDQILPQDSITGVQDLPGSFQNSIASLIPTCKYTDDIALVSKSEDVACAVCLNEFRDGEEVKVLPECLHTFHVSCIDMWLFSHSNCPLCRTDMGVSSPAYHHSESHTFQLPDSDEPQRAI
ncbi:RING-H2 FINGER PROTEIN ATL52-LIKE [Salix purpurea]|uniref:RING-type E3 ubiquitin transferase n=1 Tax=Salix purpurea TaxID=77065 RepID=A0A9Q0TUA0_SALPP|nr:RING-H2 FINGER PROTEIN ATL52-LIKE [Salix purpurea]